MRHGVNSHDRDSADVTVLKACYGATSPELVPCET